jgi:hypothetical protein
MRWRSDLNGTPLDTSPDPQTHVNGVLGCPGSTATARADDRCARGVLPLLGCSVASGDGLSQPCRNSSLATMAPLLEWSDSRLPIDDAADLRNLIGLMPAGTELDIVLYRERRQYSVNVRLGSGAQE